MKLPQNRITGFEYCLWSKKLFEKFFRLEKSAIHSCYKRSIRPFESSTYRCQFHQRFTYEFFVRTSFFYVHVTRENNVRTKNSYVKRWWNWHQDVVLPAPSVFEENMLSTLSRYQSYKTYNKVRLMEKLQFW
jgi:hypothetical protein